MLNLQEIYRPRTIQEALDLLGRPDAVALAGGTELLASRRKDVRVVVDLRTLDLAYIRDRKGAVAIGSTTLLADIADSPILRAAANGVVAQAAHRSASSLLRNQGTVTGTLIADPGGILATTLAALDATVTVLSSPPAGEQTLSVTDFLGRRDQFRRSALVTEVLMPAVALARRAAVETVARTPRDKPIVTACAVAEIYNGSLRSAAVALGGVGGTAVRAQKAEKMLVGQKMSDELIDQAALAALEDLAPTSDYRGSVDYRREMARVLTARALTGISTSA